MPETRTIPDKRKPAVSWGDGGAKCVATPIGATSFVPSLSFLIRDERSRPSHATYSRQRDQYPLHNHDLSTNWRAVIIPRIPLLSPAFGEGYPIDWFISNGTVGCYFKAVLFLPVPGTQSGGFQKMCGLISSTRLSPSCAMMRSTSVWNISSAR